MDQWGQVVLDSTRRLREDGEFEPFRRCVRDRGLDPEQVLLADYWDEDSAAWEGFLVTTDGRVFHFLFDFFDEGKEAFSEWHDITADWNRPYIGEEHYGRGDGAYLQEGIEAALDLLKNAETPP